MHSVRNTKKYLIDQVAKLKVLKQQQEMEIAELKKEIQRYARGYMQYPLYVIFDNKCEFVNQSFVDLFGYGKDEIDQTELGFMTLIAPEHRHTVEKAFYGGIKCDYDNSSFKFKALMKDGSKMECDTSVIFVPYKWGVAIHGVIYNVSGPANGNGVIEMKNYSGMTMVSQSSYQERRTNS